jgi:PAS domain S-box-containing protein
MSQAEQRTITVGRDDPVYADSVKMMKATGNVDAHPSAGSSFSPGAGNAIFHYGIAVVAVVASTSLAVLSWKFGITRGQASIFLFGIAVGAWYGGKRPAIVAVLLSTLAYDYFFIEPLYTLGINREDLPLLILFIAFAVLVTRFTAVRRKVEAELQKSRDELEIKVHERTAELRASEQKYRELIDLSPDPIFVWDKNLICVLANAAAARLRGCAEQELIGLTGIDTYLPEERRLTEERLQRARSGDVVRFERQFLRKDNQIVPVEVSLSISEGGHYQSVVRDISERKKAEEALRRSHEELELKVKERTAQLSRANEELQSVNKELEAFAYSVSHDLRAPVRHIAGFTELLHKQTESALDDKGRRYIGMILDSANRMGSLVDDLLAFSRIGRAETQKTTVKLETLIKQIVDEVAPDTHGRKIHWRIGTLPICHGDPAMLRLAFGNLISNALKFTRTREQAEIQIGSVNHQPDEIVVLVKDNGVGFDMKYKDKLFGVFQRLHSQQAFEGTGIGLATVQRIILRHGGRVWAESSVDSGAAFYVALPKAGKARV